MKRVSLTVPYSANRESSNVVPNPAAVINPRAVSGPPGAAAQRPSAYPAPVQPIANPSANFAINPSHSAPPGAGLSQPTDPRRAAAAKSANLAPATQIGQYPGQPGVGSAEPAGSGQYPMAGPGPGAGLLPGQGGAALPADFRPDPRKAARGASAFRPAGGFPGSIYLLYSIACQLFADAVMALLSMSHSLLQLMCHNSLSLLCVLQLTEQSRSKQLCGVHLLLHG